MEKKYDQKFTFAWKDGVLDFSYEQDGKLSKGKLNKSFDFGQGEETLDTESEWVKPADPMPVKEPVKLLEEQPAAPAVTPELVTPEFAPAFEAASEVPAVPEPAAVEPAPAVVMPLSAPVDEPVAAPVVPDPIVDVLVDAARHDAPTVQVRLPDTMPQIVTVDVAQIDMFRPVDPASPHAQVVVEVQDATVKVPDDCHLCVVKTPDGTSDIVIAVPPSVAEAATAVGVDVVDAVKKAIETTEIAPALPDLTPGTEAASVLPQIVGMTLEGNEVKLTDVSEKVPEDHVLKTVTTPAEMPNIVVAVDKETDKKFSDMGLDPAKELSKFIAATETAVATVNPVTVDRVYSENGVDADEDWRWENWTRWMTKKK